ncbi:Protein-only RNase P C-terminal [Arabidopsis thaliana x Arabidopsis arenosa]|nr:Protein-only RNase P C-terminal [Arabidopsis thaliana x Arabidopsis arenosa]
MLREAVLKNGGGWHGHGWVGDGKWIVKKGNVSSTGRCLSCSEQLACVDTNEVETQKFVDSLVALAMERKAKMNSCESDVVFSEFQDWLEKHGDYEAIVDGANIGLYQQNFVDGSFSLSQIQKGDRKMSPEIRTEARNLLIPGGRESFALDPVVSRSTTLRHRRRIENHHRKKPISDDAPHRRLTKPATNLPKNSTLRLTGSTTIDPDKAN